MTQTTSTIDKLNESDIVTNGDEYARVTYCIHGNPYYAYLGSASDSDLSGEEIESAILVSDWDEVSVEDCCG